MKKHIRHQSSTQKRTVSLATPRKQNPHNLTREFIETRHPTPENIVAAQGVIGNQAVMRLVAEQPMLRWGSRGDAVISLQKLLNQKNGAGLEADGIFGPLTYQAVITFQKNSGLSIDGIVGPNTWKSLNQQNIEQPPQPTPSENENNTGEQLVASIQAFKSMLEGFSMASDVDTDTSPDPANLLNEGDAPALGDAIAAVKPFVGGALQQQQDKANNVPANQPHFTNVAKQGGGTTVQKSVKEPPAVAIPKLHKEIQDLLNVLPPGVKAKIQPALAQMKQVVDQIKQGTAPTDAMITTFNTATATLLKAANNIQVPATPDGSFTKFDIKKAKPWKITADDIAGVGQALDNRVSTHGEAAHVTMTPDMKNATKEDGTTTKVEIVLTLEPELPEWTKANEVGQKCPCWKQEWDKFSSAIEAHEQQHIAIYKLFLSNLHVRCQGKSQSETDKIFDDAIEAAERAEEDFDNATKHGVIGVPSTAFNAGKSCKNCKN